MPVGKPGFTQKDFAATQQRLAKRRKRRPIAGDESDAVLTAFGRSWLNHFGTAPDAEVAMDVLDRYSRDAIGLHDVDGIVEAAKDGGFVPQDWMDPGDKSNIVTSLTTPGKTMAGVYEIPHVEYVEPQVAPQTGSAKVVAQEARNQPSEDVFQEPGEPGYKIAYSPRTPVELLDQAKRLRIATEHTIIPREAVLEHGLTKRKQHGESERQYRELALQMNQRLKARGYDVDEVDDVTDKTETAWKENTSYRAAALALGGKDEKQKQDAYDVLRESGWELNEGDEATSVREALVRQGLNPDVEASDLIYGLFVATDLNADNDATIAVRDAYKMLDKSVLPEDVVNAYGEMKHQERFKNLGVDKVADAFAAVVGWYNAANRVVDENLYIHQGPFTEENEEKYGPLENLFKTAGKSYQVGKRAVDTANAFLAAQATIAEGQLVEGGKRKEFYEKKGISPDVNKHLPIWVVAGEAATLAAADEAGIPAAGRRLDDMARGYGMDPDDAGNPGRVLYEQFGADPDEHPVGVTLVNLGSEIAYNILLDVAFGAGIGKLKDINRAKALLRDHSSNPTLIADNASFIAAEHSQAAIYHMYPEIDITTKDGQQLLKRLAGETNPDKVAELCLDSPHLTGGMHPNDWVGLKSVAMRRLRDPKAHPGSSLFAMREWSSYTVGRGEIHDWMWDFLKAADLPVRQRKAYADILMGAGEKEVLTVGKRVEKKVYAQMKRKRAEQGRWAETEARARAERAGKNYDAMTEAQLWKAGLWPSKHDHFKAFQKAIHPERRKGESGTTYGAVTDAEGKPASLVESRQKAVNEHVGRLMDKMVDSKLTPDELKDLHIQGKEILDTGVVSDTIFFKWQRDYWFKPEENIFDLARFSSGKKSRGVALANAVRPIQKIPKGVSIGGYHLNNAWVLRAASLDNVRRAYTMTLLAKPATMMRAFFMDEWQRLIFEGINPLRVFSKVKNERMPTEFWDTRGNLIDDVQFHTHVPVGPSDRRYAKWAYPDFVKKTSSDDWVRAYIRGWDEVTDDAGVAVANPTRKQRTTSAEQSVREASKLSEDQGGFAELLSDTGLDAEQFITDKARPIMREFSGDERLMGHLRRGHVDEKEMKTLMGEWEAGRVKLPAIVARKAMRGAGPKGIEDVNNAMWSITTALGRKGKQLLWEKRFLSERERLLDLRARGFHNMSDDAIDVIASRHGTRYANKIMYSGRKTVLEDNFKNAMLFLTPFREFMAYWSGVAVKHPFGFGANVVAAKKTLPPAVKTGPFVWSPTALSFVLGGPAKPRQPGEHMSTYDLLIDYPVGAGLPSLGWAVVGESYPEQTRFLEGRYPFQYFHPGQPLNNAWDRAYSAFNARVFHRTGTLPWILGRDSDMIDRNVNTELRNQVIRGEKPNVDKAYEIVGNSLFAETAGKGLSPVNLSVSPDVARGTVYWRDEWEKAVDADDNKARSEAEKNPTVAKWAKYRYMDTKERYDYLNNVGKYRDAPDNSDLRGLVLTQYYRGDALLTLTQEEFYKSLAEQDISRFSPPQFAASIESANKTAVDRQLVYDLNMEIDEREKGFAKYIKNKQKRSGLENVAWAEGSDNYERAYDDFLTGRGDFKKTGMVTMWNGEKGINLLEEQANHPEYTPPELDTNTVTMANILEDTYGDDMLITSFSNYPLIAKEREEAKMAAQQKIVSLAARQAASLTRSDTEALGIPKAKQEKFLDVTTAIGNGWARFYKTTDKNGIYWGSEKYKKLQEAQVAWQNEKIAKSGLNNYLGGVGTRLSFLAKAKTIEPPSEEVLHREAIGSHVKTAVAKKFFKQALGSGFSGDLRSYRQKAASKMNSYEFAVYNESIRAFCWKYLLSQGGAVRKDLSTMYYSYVNKSGTTVVMDWGPKGVSPDSDTAKPQRKFVSELVSALGELSPEFRSEWRVLDKYGVWKKNKLVNSGLANKIIDYRLQ